MQQQLTLYTDMKQIRVTFRHQTGKSEFSLVQLHKLF